MTKSKPLTVPQRLVLTTSAQRPDRLVLPLPAELRARGGARNRLLSALLKLQLVEEFPVDDADIAWRTAEGDCHLALRLTSAGFATAGNPEVASAPSDDAAAPPAGVASASTTKEVPAADPMAEESGRSSPTGKLGQVLQAISAKPGATLAEITTLTSWLPHTARAAVTGLRQRGFPIQLVEQDGRKAYRRTASG